MAQQVEIINPEFIEYYQCEQQRRDNAWLSSAILAGLGLAITLKYYDEYSDVVDERKALNDKIYNCAYKEHQHWHDRTYPHALATFDWIYTTPEIDPQYGNPIDQPPTAQMHTAAQTLAGWATDGCLGCGDPAGLLATKTLADVNSLAALTANQERRSEYRREFKSAGMDAVDSAGKNLGAPGRQSMGVGLNMINTLVAMAASGMNGGLNMMGRGLADLGGSNWGANT